MKHTKGEWKVIKNRFTTSIKTDRTDICVLTSGSSTSNKANAKLIAEVGTVANETGKTPRQLADINADLLGALKDLISSGIFKNYIAMQGRATGKTFLKNAWVKAKQAIKEATS